MIRLPKVEALTPEEVEALRSEITVRVQETYPGLYDIEVTHPSGIRKALRGAVGREDETKMLVSGVLNILIFRQEQEKARHRG